ncbi:hypothetical protein ESOMN_v1c02070 [Williamsoniiplasma somnilux]|uniref:Uncharacterized protein n=1 Tax=Williamsoniiplasma somnilux TaxID=215578 RepID=A0A2K8P0R0_9MOLU|nr:hypothetical protein [Williamsoniiplasma somnilux]ATZ18591.1 hypothetical protein ESOMN_v1c02070 [Williamsoniiplasma somnilux]
MKSKLKNFNISLTPTYLKNLSRRTKIIITSIAMSTPIVLGAALTLPGMGIESLKFISSVDDFIEKNIPKGKYVLKTSGTFSKTVIDGLKSSYLADVMSATNWSASEGTADKRRIYEAYTNLWFETRWGKVIEDQKSIDLYDVSKDLIEFDRAFAGIYHDFGYVNPGLTWIFQPGTLGRLFNPNLKKTEWYTNVVTKQTTIDQNTYNNSVISTGPGLTGVNVQNSIGANIVNNKVWFLNIQRENIKLLMEMNLGGLTGIFEKAPKDMNDIPPLAKVSDLYQPNFVRGIRTTQVGISFLFIIGPLSLIAGGVGIHLIKKNNPKKGDN